MEENELVICQACCQPISEDDQMDGYNQICKSCIQEELSGSVVFNDEYDLEGNIDSDVMNDE